MPTTSTIQWSLEVNITHSLCCYLETIKKVKKNKNSQTFMLIRNFYKLSIAEITKLMASKSVPKPFDFFHGFTTGWWW